MSSSSYHDNGIPSQLGLPAFVKYKKISRSLPKLNRVDIAPVFNLPESVRHTPKGPVHHIYDDMNSLSVTSKEISPITKDIKRLEFIKKEIDGSNVLLQDSHLIHSFGILDNQSNEDIDDMWPGKVSKRVQTEHILYKRKFNDFKEQKAWMSESVDPFIHELKKSIHTNKPSNVAEYCLDYCSAKLTGKAIPTTVAVDDDVTETSVVNASQEKEKKGKLISILPDVSESS